MPPRPIDAGTDVSASTERRIIGSLAAVAAAYIVLAGVQVRHWAEYRPLPRTARPPSPPTLQWATLKRVYREGGVGELFRGGHILFARLFVVLCCVVFAISVFKPAAADGATDRAVAGQVSKVAVASLLAWAATYPLGAQHVAAVLGADDPMGAMDPPNKFLRAGLLSAPVFLANLAHAGLLSLAGLQWLLHFAFDTSSVVVLTGFTLACVIVSWPLRVAAVRIIATYVYREGVTERPKDLPPYDGLLATCRAIRDEEGWEVLLGW
ncbi:uncharacterized protein LOC62_04G005374 [Vanrija pseudolonga]|uniref:Uncharacterized protein n=1 Tax=Vanrija pseudolonga TaxID=143232 RepID=A0AAF0YCC0_9TREE|nr:hypothetical protein LOC62_04G005374 [Vanrija pseudolonga]